jgi:four helix bundle protein
MSFKELKVWQEARDLAVDIYKIVNENKFSREFSLKDQIIRSVVSISSNIAEGYERTTDKEFLRYLDIATGSLSERRTQIDIAASIKYLNQADFIRIEDLCCKIGAMMTNLKKARNKTVTRSLGFPIHRSTDNRTTDL